MKLMKTAAIVAAAATVLVLSACGTTQTGSSAGSTSDHLTIGVSFDLVNDIRNAELASLKAAAAKQGDKIVFVSADQDAQKQASQIQDLIQTKKVDAIVAIAVNNDQIASSIALANSSKVPFIAIDRAVSGNGKVTFQVTGDPVADGKVAAKEVLDAGGNPVIIQLVGALTDQNAVGRRDGFTAGIEAGGQKVSAQVPTDWDPTKALDGTANALQSNPKVNTIFIPSDYLLPSVQSALKAAGRLKPVGDPGHVFIVTIDGDPNGCKAIKDGLMDADVVTPVGTFGEQAIAAAHTANAGKAVTPATSQVAGFPLNQANLSTTESTVWGCTK
ncbi:MAG TPA: sugar ABC transporter substrate-binding protein [Galbitalea sp.]|jgi:ABC-type sugar transport system substrate-binding protein